MEANPGAVVGVALEVELGHNYIQVLVKKIEEQEEEPAHNHIQEMKVVEVAHPYPDTSLQNMSYQTLPDQADSLRPCMQERIR